MRTRVIILICILAVMVSLALAEKASVAELKARLANARPEDRGKICLEIAEQQVAAADKLYTDGKIEEAQAVVSDVVTYSQQAGEEAGKSGRHVKNTEIALRKMARRLTDVKHTLASDNQPPVQAAIDTLEKIRTDLLNHMFGKKPK
jgi:polyhydroxyalkanoate synthesis regulator phasin